MGKKASCWLSEGTSQLEGKLAYLVLQPNLEMDRSCTGYSEQQLEESNRTILASRISVFHAEAEGAAVFCRLYVRSDTRR